MKKFFATILSILYLVTSSGATINFHFCMDKFIDWDLSLPLNSKCSNCGMTKENKKGCCSDKHQTFQIKKDQLTASVNAIPASTFYYLNTQYPFQSKPLGEIYVAECYSAHSPPGLKIISPFILHCVFRI